MLWALQIAASNCRRVNFEIGRPVRYASLPAEDPVANRKSPATARRRKPRRSKPAATRSAKRAAVRLSKRVVPVRSAPSADARPTPPLSLRAGKPMAPSSGTSANATHSGKSVPATKPPDSAHAGMPCRSGDTSSNDTSSQLAHLQAILPAALAGDYRAADKLFRFVGLAPARRAVER